MKFLAKKILAAAGWTLKTEKSLPEKFVMIGAPHTSNWDGIWMLLISVSLGIKPCWMVKDSYQKNCFWYFFKKMGAIPVDRKNSGLLVSQLAAKFNKMERMALFLAPEGSREYREYWKSGFYHIAEEASVPLVLAFLDYEKKIAGIGPTILPCKSAVIEDMNKIRNFYKGIKGRYPEKFGPVRLHEEESSLISSKITDR